MKSSTGKYFIGLDHVRAVAAFMVFSWHFVHIHNGHLAPPPIFPLSLLSEGHTGVALFMALSGYVFAKLLDGKRVIYSAFIWNRFLRLAPLLLAVLLFIGLQNYIAGVDLLEYVQQILVGLVLPSLPSGGWSITVELHFYLILPLLLFFTRKWKYSLLVVLAASLFLRFLLHQKLGQVQMFAFWTIAGRIDQFVLGILAYQLRRGLSCRHTWMLLSTLGFLAFYWYFDHGGGFYTSTSYPSPSAIWIYLPTVEGLFYAFSIAWYDNSFEHSSGRLSRFLAFIGTCSYSIYLLHFFVVFKLSGFIDAHVIDLSSLHLAIAFSILGFLLMVPVGYVGFRFVESPFLKMRRNYLIEDDTEVSV